MQWNGWVQRLAQPALQSPVDWDREDPAVLEVLALGLPQVAAARPAAAAAQAALELARPGKSA